MNSTTRRFAGRILCASLLACSALPAHVSAQQPYPNRPVKWVVPFPPGGATDAIARLVSHQVEKSLGQPVVVDNRPGGNTFIAAQALRTSPADGYTMMVATTDLVIASNLYKAPFDIEKDFECVGQMSAGRPFLLVARKEFPANNIREAIAYFRAHPGKVTYASYGNGSISQLIMESFTSSVNAKLLHVPYKGAAPALQDIMSGQVDVMADTAFNSLPMAQGGKLKVLGILGRERFPELPNVMTMEEAGVPITPENDFTSFISLLVAKGTPPQAIQAMGKAVDTALQDSALRDGITQRAFVPQYMASKDFCAKMQRDYRLMKKIINEAGIKADS